MTVFYAPGVIGTASPVSGVVSVANSGPVAGLPAAIPRDELFYWTRAWQEGEHESVAALGGGDVHEFASGREAVRWLLDANDDE